jgi:uncharacterized protein
LTNYITLPGIGGSGEAHWHTIWEKQDPNFQRFRPSSWNEPDLTDWIDALDESVAASNPPPVLVAHSLACLLVAHWAARSEKRIAGAFLVSVPDPKGPKFPAAAEAFGPVPQRRLRFPALILASTNDGYGTVEYAQRRSEEWGAPLIALGPLGHVNASSNLGDWTQGRHLLAAFTAGLGG